MPRRQAACLDRRACGVCAQGTNARHSGRSECFSAQADATARAEAWGAMLGAMGAMLGAMGARQPCAQPASAGLGAMLGASAVQASGHRGMHGTLVVKRRDVVHPEAGERVSDPGRLFVEHATSQSGTQLLHVRHQGWMPKQSRRVL